MHAKVTVILVQCLQGGDIRGPFYDLIHPLDGPHHLVAFFLSEDWRTLVLGNLRFEGSRKELLLHNGISNIHITASSSKASKLI